MTFQEIDRKAVKEMLPALSQDELKALRGFIAGCETFRAETGRDPEFDEAAQIYEEARKAAGVAK